MRIKFVTFNDIKNTGLYLILNTEYVDTNLSKVYTSLINTDHVSLYVVNSSDETLVFCGNGEIYHTMNIQTATRADIIQKVKEIVKAHQVKFDFLTNAYKIIT